MIGGAAPARCIYAGDPGRNLSIVKTYGESRSHLVECRACGLVRFIDEPRPEDLGRFYNAEMGRNDPEREYADETLAAVLSLFGKVFAATGGTARHVHDDGCGSGYIVHHLNRAGIAATGTDISQQAIDFGRAAGNAKLGVGSAADFLAERSIVPDLIFTQHALEHFYDPLVHMRNLHDLLSPGGHLVVMIPNRDYILTLRQGMEADPAFIYPMHLNYFTAEGLRCLLGQAGFAVKYLENTRNFGFSATMEADVLRSLSELYPQSCSDEERLERAQADVLLYELLCVAQRD